MKTTPEQLQRHASLSIRDPRELCRDEYLELLELDEQFLEEEEDILAYLAGQEDFIEVSA